MKKILILCFFLVLLPIIVQAGNYTQSMTNTTTRVNQSFSLDAGTRTPYEIWVIAGVVGLGLFLLSLLLGMSGNNIEIGTVISIMAWLPIGFCAYASFAVDKLTSFGVTSQAGEYVLLENHIVFSNPVVGVLMFVFLVVAIVNTMRLIALNRVFAGRGE